MAKDMRLIHIKLMWNLDVVQLPHLKKVLRKPSNGMMKTSGG